MQCRDATVARFAYIDFFMFVFCRKWFGCLCAKHECDSSSSPAGKFTLSPAVGHADSAHSLNHQRREKATHKEGFTGHDAVMSWLEKADNPSPDDDMAPIRKVCYTAITSCMTDEASPTHINVPSPPCMPPAGGSNQMSTHHCVPLTLLGVADASCISLL